MKSEIKLYRYTIDKLIEEMSSIEFNEYDKGRFDLLTSLLSLFVEEG